jgi:hypothetical protein
MKRSELMTFSATRSRRVKAQRIAKAAITRAVDAEAAAHAATKSKLRNAEYAIRTAKEEGATAVLRAQHLEFFRQDMANALARSLAEHLNPILEKMKGQMRPPELRAMFDHPGPLRFDAALILDASIPELRYRCMVPNY